MTNKKEQPQEEATESAAPNLVDLLKDFKDAPADTDIEKWKQKFGETFVSGFSETELFVWRPLSRMEYVELQKKLVAQVPEAPFTDWDFEEAVVKICVLWGSDDTLIKKGGSISTLSEQIMTNSNFMAPQMASVLVMKL
jgi:hypothetical protein